MNLEVYIIIIFQGPMGITKLAKVCTEQKKTVESDTA